ncbi:unnamed protein product, partial [Closterium sp. Naga37s-1]
RLIACFASSTSSFSSAWDKQLIWVHLPVCRISSPRWEARSRKARTAQSMAWMSWPCCKPRVLPTSRPTPKPAAKAWPTLRRRLGNRCWRLH